MTWAGPACFLLEPSGALRRTFSYPGSYPSRSGTAGFAEDFSSRRRTVNGPANPVPASLIRATAIVDLEPALVVDAAVVGSCGGVRHQVLSGPAARCSLRAVHPSVAAAHCRRHRCPASGPLAVQPEVTGTGAEPASLAGTVLPAGGR